MKSEKQEILQYILFDTGVENLFISEYMPKAPGNCVKLYLLAQMYAQIRQPMENQALAKELGITAEEVEAAWDYWEKEGLLVRRKTAGSDYDIELVNLRELAFGQGKAIVKEQTPLRSVDEQTLSRLYSRIENTCGRMLEPKEIEAVAVWISEYGMDPDFILSGYQYCSERSKSTKYSYVGKILKDWQEKGLKTDADVRNYLADMDQHYDLYRRVFRALGFTNRAPGEEEKRRMNRWVDEMGFSTDRILEACGKTSGISSPNINYVDSVLNAWYKEEHGLKEVSKEDLIAQVRASYEKDREENKRKTEENRDRIYTQIPRIRSIMTELKDSGYLLSKALFLGVNGKASVEKERRRQKALNEEKLQLLAQGGFPPDAADPVYTCPICKDTGELEDGSTCSCFGRKLEALQRQTKVRD